MGLRLDVVTARTAALADRALIYLPSAGSTVKAAPLNLPRPRRPPELDGYGRDPVYELDQSALGPRLLYRPDPDDPGKHGFVEPAGRTTFEDYQRALWSTRSSWTKVRP